MTMIHIACVASFACFITLGAIYLGWILEKEHYQLPIGFGSAFRFAFSKSGLLGSSLVPLLCFGLFHGFVAHVWFTLQRWPVFGEQLHQPWLQIHFDFLFFGMVAMIFSQIGIGIALLLSIAFSPLRWMCFCCATELCFSLGTFLTIHLAPRDFLNWLFD